VVVVVGALATGGVAAATTGHLPEPVRQAARSILASGGEPATLEPPEPAPVATTGSGGAGLGGAPSTGAPGGGLGAAASGSVAQPELEGLCRAFLAGKGGEQGEKLDATAFEALSRAAGGDDQMRTFCQRLVAVDAKQEPKEPRQNVPPGNEDHGLGGPPATTGGGQGQGSPPASQPSPAANPSGNDGTVKPR
jgi:hypothetical protein